MLLWDLTKRGFGIDKKPQGLHNDEWENIIIEKAENETSTPQGEAQRVGESWKPDAGAGGEWPWEPQTETAIWRK
jgi:hypothetical protein